MRIHTQEGEPASEHTHTHARAHTHTHRAVLCLNKHWKLSLTHIVKDDYCHGDSDASCFLEEVCEEWQEVESHIGRSYV